ncbi:MAG: segregation/condensation protein A [Planctomycetota bacterium]
MQEPTVVTQTNTPNPQPPTPNSPTDYRIRLDAYAGPMDLLLYLVKRHEIDLHDIPMAKLTEQYLSHLEVIKQIDVESAGEFLVMAATLVEVKSRMIIPAGQRADDADPTDDIPDEPEADPRFELVQQLLAYKAYKDAAYALEERAEEWEDRFPVKAKAGERPAQDEDAAEEKTLDLEDINVFDLCEAFGQILESVGHVGDHEVTYDDTPISLHAEDIHDRLKRDAPAAGLSLAEIFEGRQGKSEMIGLFLATLELVRQHLVTVVVDERNPTTSRDREGADPPARQDPAQGPLPDGRGSWMAKPSQLPGSHIRLVLVPDSERQQDQHDTDAATDWTDPETGKMQYDWPDDESRLRFERRERLRSTLQAKADAEAKGEAFDLKQYKAQQAEEGQALDELDEEELAIEEDDADYLEHGDDT